MKAYAPLTAAQKKKIAKRADKIDRTKATTAGVGVSFGAVLAIALFGWRMHGRLNRASRSLERLRANQSAPAEVGDPAVMFAEVDKYAARMLKEPGTAEAREWLDPAKFPNHAVMEMSADHAREMVAGFYERGAERVAILDPTKLGDAMITAEIAIKLPQDPAKRKACLEWAARWQEADKPEQDLGQQYLVISTD
jgi:hypothetical protein